MVDLGPLNMLSYFYSVSYRKEKGWKSKPYCRSGVEQGLLSLSYQHHLLANTSPLP